MKLTRIIQATARPAVLTVALSLSLSQMARAQMVTVNMKLSPAGSFQAQTSSVQGKVQLVGGNVKAQMIKVPLNTLKSSVKLRDDHMKDKYLEVKKYPNAELTFGEGKDGKGKGKLKVRGIEKDVEGTYVVKGKTVEATFPIKLSDYKIEGIRYMGVGVKDEAEIIAVVPVQ